MSERKESRGRKNWEWAKRRVIRELGRDAAKAGESVDKAMIAAVAKYRKN